MTIEKAFPAMGTVHIITIFDAEGPGAANDARAYLLRLNQAWSCFQADSLISRINRAAGVAPVAVDEDTFAVLQQARRYGGLTDGAFDVTVGPLAQLWREAMERRQLPADGDVWQALQLVDWRSILLDEKGQTAMLHRPGQRIDLGGIAKGYAADGLRKFLRQHGVRRALLDLGGTVLSLGGRLPVGIRDPFRPAGAPMGTLMLEDRLAVTSGVYERFAWLGGHRYHHIVDRRADPGPGEERAAADGAGHGRHLRDGSGSGAHHPGSEERISPDEQNQHHERRSSERRVERSIV